MNKTLKRLMQTNERIVCAYAEPASGPGWANQPLWVIVQQRGGGPMRAICLQPDEQPTGDFWRFVYHASAIATGTIVKALKNG